MNHTSLRRRLLAGAAGLAVGLGGALAVGTSPAQAEEWYGQTDADKNIVNCQTWTFTVKHDPELNPHPWRAVLQPDDPELDDIVVWQSGDWPADADLGSDPSAWGEGWATSGPFEVTADIEDTPNGEIHVQWWKHDAETPHWEPYTIGGKKFWVRKYERPCGWVGTIEVTQPTCESPGTVVIPGTHPEDQHGDKPGHGLTYTINGEEVAPGTHELAPGTYTIVGYRVGGVKDYRKEWTVEIEPADCPTPSPSPSEPPPPDEGEGGELPVTGSSTTLIAGGAIVLLAVGGGLFLVARRRRVTFTA